MKKGDKVRIKDSSSGLMFGYGIKVNKTYSINKIVNLGDGKDAIILDGVPMEDGDYFFADHWEVCKESNVKKILKYYEENS